MHPFSNADGLGLKTSVDDNSTPIALAKNT